MLAQSNTNSHSCFYCHADSYTYSDTHSYSYAKTYSIAKAPPQPASSPYSVAGELGLVIRL